MTYAGKLDRWRRKTKRPAHYEGLILHPINDAPDTDPEFMPGWEDEHAGELRFRLGGVTWFQNNTGLNANNVAAFREEAIDRFNELVDAGKVNWRQMPGLQANHQLYWSSVARQQFNGAFGGSRIYLSKLMYVLLACELAVAEQIKKGRRLPNIAAPFIERPEDIYQQMSAIPSCWNVNKFNKDSVAVQVALDPEFLTKVARACGHPDQDTRFLVDLTGGRTVQYDIAKAIERYCIAEGIDLGGTPKARARAGTYLGVGPASEFEQVDCG